MTGTTTEAAWAKLNLSLDVLGARSDGFHDLRMVMQSVDLHDDVTVTLDDTGVCRAETNRSYLPCGADNVAVRAAQVFLSRAGLTCGVHIRLHKRIPVCAGLGGGSSDAAAVLRALERLTGAGFTRAELEEMGAQVGSDVPYCVAGGTMLAEGRGERLTPVTPMPRMPVVICKPDFPISTPELFHRVDARTSRCRPDTEGICAALADGDMPRLARRMYNVFEDVLTHREGEIAAIKSRLLDGGALGEIYHARTVGFRRRNRPFVDGFGSKDFVNSKTAGGGALYDFGIYHISLMLYLMGMPAPRRMSGQLYQKIAMDEARRLESGFDVEELGVGLVRFDRQVTMDLFESWAVHLDQMDPGILLGSKGGLKLEPFSFHTTICDTELDCTGDLEKMNFRWLNTQPLEYAYASSEAHWIAALLGRVPMLPTAQLALDTLLIQDGIRLSSQLGREVTAEETIAASVSTAATI